MMDAYLNYWRQLKISERRLILAAFWVILAALVWLFAIAPALKVRPIASAIALMLKFFIFPPINII